MERIDLYLDALERATATEGDIVPWPMHVACVAPYFSDHESRDLFAKLRRLTEQRVPERAISELFPGPTAVKTSLTDLVIGLKVPSEPTIPVDQRIWYVERVFDVLEQMQAGDIFCRDDRNLVLGSDQIGALVRRSHWSWTETQPELPVLAQRVSAGALSLAWSMYFYAWPNVGFELHGPYDVTLTDGRKARLLIRDFFDTKPALLWPSMGAFPYSALRILTLYKPDTDLHMDIYNHLTHRANLLDATSGVCVEADGVPLTQEQVVSLVKHLLQAVSAQNKAVRAMGTEELISKFIEVRYYVFRRLRTYFQQDWRPPRDVLQRIKDWGLIEIPPSGPPDWDMLRKAFDPRTDFIPGGPISS